MAGRCRAPRPVGRGSPLCAALRRRRRGLGVHDGHAGDADPLADRTERNARGHGTGEPGGTRPASAAKTTLPPSSVKHSTAHPTEWPSCAGPLRKRRDAAPRTQRCPDTGLSTPSSPCSGATGRASGGAGVRVGGAGIT